MRDTVLKTITTGVYVLTAQNQEKMNGSAVTWVTPVSYDPLLIMVSLAGLRYSHELVKASGYFGLNVLSSDQVELARHFGLLTARETDKLAGIAFSTSEHGLPILDEARAYLECRVVGSYPAGDHTLFVGEVVSATMFRDAAQPLIFKQDDYL
ncbi:MAG: flavin reductase family protein [Pseudomonadota bacterium]